MCAATDIVEITIRSASNGTVPFFVSPSWGTRKIFESKRYIIFTKPVFHEGSIVGAFVCPYFASFEDRGPVRYFRVGQSFLVMVLP